MLIREGELLYALISASMPALNQYLRRFDTRNVTQIGCRPAQDGFGGGDYEMSNLPKHRMARRGINTPVHHGNGNIDRIAVQRSHTNFKALGFAVHYARNDGPHVNESNHGIFSVLQDDASLERQGSEDCII